jgi:hypothetical protein
MKFKVLILIFLYRRSLDSGNIMVGQSHLFLNAVSCDALKISIMTRGQTTLGGVSDIANSIP